MIEEFLAPKFSHFITERKKETLSCYLFTYNKKILCMQNVCAETYYMFCTASVIMLRPKPFGH